MTYIVSQSENQLHLKELKDVFIRFDESGDGHLQLEEITTGLREVLGFVKGSMRIFEDILTSLDKNCNGVIDYTEFLTAAADKEKLLSEANLRFAFNMFDTNQDGTISKPELRGAFETGDKKDEALWNEIFEEVDTDGDGTITFAEFKESMNKVTSSTNRVKYLVQEANGDP